MSKQEAQLSQRDRATLRVIEYFAKSLKVKKFIRRACVSTYWLNSALLMIFAAWRLD